MKKDEIILIKPTMDQAEEIMRFREEFLAHDPKEDMGGAGNLRDCEKAQEWIDYVEAVQSRETCPKELVDSDIFIALRTSDHRLVGIIEFRHHIEHPVLGVWGGHIGYCIRPSERRKGYGKEMLRLMLKYCKAYGLDRVMITCSETNTASERTILSNGGVYEKTVWAKELSEYMKRFWIRL